VSGTGTSSAVQSEPDVASVFRRLADEWYEATEGLSFIQKKIAHPAYYQIIGLGPDVLPLLLRELQTSRSHWFWALRSISRENPVRPGATFDQTVEDWLTWGKTRGLID
jgi:hypothetical protein